MAPLEQHTFKIVENEKLIHFIHDTIHHKNHLLSPKHPIVFLVWYINKKSDMNEVHG